MIHYCPYCMCKVRPRKHLPGLVGAAAFAMLSLAVLGVLVRHVWGLRLVSAAHMTALNNAYVCCAWGGVVAIIVVAALVYAFVPYVCPQCGVRTTPTDLYRKM